MTNNHHARWWYQTLVIDQIGQLSRDLIGLLFAVSLEKKKKVSLPTLNGKLPFAYWKRVGGTAFPDGAITSKAEASH